jgi:hypothetical protein
MAIQAAATVQLAVIVLTTPSPVWDMAGMAKQQMEISNNNILTLRIV